MMSIAFTPVPVRARRDGWTPARQAAFVLALADTHCVVTAARAVGMSWQTAYRLRARPDAASFAAAWDRAVAGPALDSHFTGRALGGTAMPITYRGKRIGERRRYDNRLAMYLLSIRRPERYGAQREQRPAAPRDPIDALAQALGALRADLAAGTTRRDEADSRADVVRASSPSTPSTAAIPGAGHRPACRKTPPEPPPLHPLASPFTPA